MSILSFLSLSAYAAGPILKHKDADEQREFQNVYDDIGKRAAENGPVLSSTGASQGVFNVGVGPVSTFTVTAASAGGALSGTYYYNVYPVNNLNQVGEGFHYASVNVSGGNNAVSVVWAGVAGAVKYYIGRGATSDGYDGYYSVTGTTYTDTGATFTGSGGPAFPCANCQYYPLRVHGSILLPASNGPIRWNNFETGLPDGFIGQSSAGEMEYLPGSSGAAKGDHVFEDENAVQLMKMTREINGVSSSRTQLTAYATGNALNDFLLTAGSSVTLAPNNTDTFVFRTSRAEFTPDLRMNSGTKVYWNISGGVSTGTSTGFDVANSSAVRVSINNLPFTFLNTQFSPPGDGLQNLGSSSAHWSTVFATNGTINTSMSKYKKNIRGIDPLKISVPRGVYYQWKDPKSKDNERPFIGFLADDLPKESFYWKEDGSIDDKSVYQNAVIGILCAHVRDLEKRIAVLEARGK